MCARRMVGIAWNLIAPTGCKPGKSGGFDPLRVKMELGCAVQFGVGRKQGFQVLHQNRIADAAATDIKMMNRRSSLFGRVKKWFVQYKKTNVRITSSGFSLPFRRP